MQLTNSPPSATAAGAQAPSEKADPASKDIASAPCPHYQTLPHMHAHTTHHIKYTHAHTHIATNMQYTHIIHHTCLHIPNIYHIIPHMDAH